MSHSIAANNGYVFQIIGDALCAAFFRAVSALGAILAALHAGFDEQAFACLWAEGGSITEEQAVSFALSYRIE